MQRQKSNKLLIEILFAIFLVTLLIPAGVVAGSVKMVPSDTVGGSGALWNLQPSCGAGNCHVSYLIDGVDANYVWSLTGLSHLVRMSNTSGIPGGAAIDSFVVWFRCAVNNTGANDRVRPRIRSTGTSNYCDGVNMNIETTTFADSSQKFTTWPTAANTCTGGILSVARMDSMELQILDVTGDTNKVTECSVVVFYTETGGAVKERLRHMQLLQISYEGGFDWLLGENWVMDFKESEWVWRE